MVGVGLRDRKGGEARRVKVTTDPTQDHRDRYGRLLAYVKGLRGSFGGAQLRAGRATVYFESFRAYPPKTLGGGRFCGLRRWQCTLPLGILGGR